jgi:hypothetical protein
MSGISQIALATQAKVVVGMDVLFAKRLRILENKT